MHCFHYGTLLMIYLLFSSAGCAKREDNPDVRPYLAYINATSKYDDMLTILVKNCSARGRTFNKAKMLEPASLLFKNPGKMSISNYIATIDFTAKGYYWSYEVTLYFDGNNEILAVHYMPFTKFCPPPISYYKWQPEWKKQKDEQ